MKNDQRIVFIFESEDERDFLITKLQTRVRPGTAGEELMKIMERESAHTKLVAIHVYRDEKDRMLTVKLQIRMKNGTTTWRVYDPKAKTKTEDQSIEQVAEALNQI